MDKKLKGKLQRRFNKALKKFEKEENFFPSSLNINTLIGTTDRVVDISDAFLSLLHASVEGVSVDSQYQPSYRLYSILAMSKIIPHICVPLKYRKSIQNYIETIISYNALFYGDKIRVFEDFEIFKKLAAVHLYTYIEFACIWSYIPESKITSEDIVETFLELYNREQKFNSKDKRGFMEKPLSIMIDNKPELSIIINIILLEHGIKL